MSETIEGEVLAPAAIHIEPPRQVVALGPAQRALEAAQAFTLDSPDMADLCGENILEAKARFDTLEAMRKELVKPFNDGHATVMSWFRRPQEIWKQVETTYKGKISAWNEQQRQARAKAEAEAAEVLLKRAEKALAEAAKLEAKGKPEQAEAVRNVAAAMPTSVVLPPPPKVAGISEAWNYDYELVDLFELAKFVVENPIFLNCIQANPTAMRQQVRAMKEAFAFPGCKLVKTPIVRARR